MSTSQDIISLLCIDETQWYKPFLCKFILAMGDYLNSQARGATIKGIKIDVLAALELPDMPIDQQRIIATVFKTLIKEGRILECIGFAADCSARLLGNRMGKNAEKRKAMP